VVLTSLTLHWANAGVLEVKPILHGIPVSCTLGEADLVICVVPIDKVLHDASRFEQVDSLAVGEGIGECGDSSIRIDL
jgi:hypothetical protein